MGNNTAGGPAIVVYNKGLLIYALRDGWACGVLSCPPEATACYSRS